MFTVKPPGIWLDEGLTSSETAQVLEIASTIERIKDNFSEDSLSEIYPLMNSFMHFLYQILKKQYGFKASESGIIDKSGNYFDLVSFTIDFVINACNKDGIMANVTPEISSFSDEIKLALPRLQSIVPQKHLIPNNKLANSLTKDIIDAGDIDLIVSGQGKNEIKTRCVLSYEGENVKLLSRHPFTEYDRNVADAVTSLYEYGDESHLVTPATVYRAMVHATESETPSPQQIGAVTRSLDKMRFVRVQVDCSDELESRKISLNGIPITNKKIDTYLLALDKREVIAGGQKISAYKILETPVLYDYSRLTGQVITAPAALLDIRDSSGGKISNTERRIAVKGYLLRRIAVMQGKTKNNQSNHILYETVYNAVADNKELSRKDQQIIRDYIADVLKYWKKQGFIKGYTETTKGKKKIGIEISI